MNKKILFLLPMILSSTLFPMMLVRKDDSNKKSRYYVQLQKKEDQQNDSPTRDLVLAAKYNNTSRLCFEPELRGVNFETVHQLSQEQRLNVDFLLQQTRLGDRVEVDRDRYNGIVDLNSEIKNCFPKKTCYIPATFKTKAIRVLTKAAIGAGALGTAGFVVGGVVGGWVETSHNSEIFEHEKKNMRDAIYNETFDKKYAEIHADKVLTEIVKNDCYANTVSKSFLEWAPPAKYGQQKRADQDMNEYGKYLGEETKKFVEQEKSICIENRTTKLEGFDYYSDENMIIEDVQVNGDGRGHISHGFERWGDSILSYCATKHDTPQIRALAEQEAISFAQNVTQKALEKCIEPVAVNFSLNEAGKGAGMGIVAGGALGIAYSVFATDDLTRPMKAKEIPKMIKQI